MEDDDDDDGDKDKDGHKNEPFALLSFPISQCFWSLLVLVEMQPMIVQGNHAIIANISSFNIPVATSSL